MDLVYWKAVFYFCLVVCPIILLLWPLYLGWDLGKNRSIGGSAGFWFGLILNWVGVLIVYCYPYIGPTKPCPFCAERMKVEAVVCKHCSRDLVRQANSRPD